MAVAELTGVSARSWRALAAPVRIGILYLLSRLVTTGFFIAAAQLSTPASRYGAHPGVPALLMGWDAQWYWFIAVHGYPSTLQVDDAGAVVQNQWAFMPVYPYLARLLGGTGVGWQPAAICISLVAGYLAALVLYALLRPRVGAAVATWAVLLFASAPLAAIFQIGYAESLFLLWLFLALWAVMRRRYGWLYLLVPLMGFTRPGVLAFALMLALHGVHRWLIRRREPLPLRQGLHIVALGLWAAVVGLSWPVIAGAVTGRPDAYLATELSWRAGWGAGAAGGFVPFQAFWQGAAFWLRTWGLGEAAGYVVLAVLLALVAAALLFARRVRRLGVEIRLWSASYLLYLLAVFFPQSSLFRLLVPLSPLWGAVVPRSRVWRFVMLAACLAGQWWWIYTMYAVGNTFWQIP
ncbi:hypothetical protein GCM10022240_12740 [Microbacterium kribbense]|uniref:Integral membrane protein n=1 Tax=Microbacterium kribbense TaxID=433645 RepID=A0ABP7GDL9_9MICO